MRCPPLSSTHPTCPRAATSTRFFVGIYRPNLTFRLKTHQIDRPAQSTEGFNARTSLDRTSCCCDERPRPRPEQPEQLPRAGTTTAYIVRCSFRSNGAAFSGGWVTYGSRVRGPYHAQTNPIIVIIKKQARRRRGEQQQGDEPQARPRATTTAHAPRPRLPPAARPRQCAQARLCRHGEAPAARAGPFIVV